MKIYQVDAFAAALFQGNPAAVVPLPEWLPDAVMQDIAMENNLAETAFIVPSPGAGGQNPSQGVGGQGSSQIAGGRDGYDYLIRWFTPTVEVELCGHATLASGHVVFRHLNFPGDVVVFRSLYSGDLNVSRDGAGVADRLVLDFPANVPVLVDPSVDEGLSGGSKYRTLIFEGLRIAPRELYRGRHDYMVVLDDQRQIETLSPDFKILAAVDGRGIVVTAPGKEVDFVSRCFYPQSGIDEDPVTGSAHTMMIPFWAARLGKNKLSAIQLSRRRGYLDCTLAGERVYIAGMAHTFLVGEIFV